jgi:glycosyltransferase involved in cell wall biosynthesis
MEGIMRKIKVLHIHGGRTMCGVATHIITLLRHLSKDKFEVYLALLHHGHVAETAENYGIKPFIVESNFPGDLRCIVRLNSYIREKRIDIVHTHTLSGNLYGRLASVLPPRPIIVTTVHTYMSDVLGDIYNKASWRTFIIWQNRLTDRLSSVLITPSIALKKTLASKGVNPDKINVVCNGIDIPLIHDPSQPDASVREEFGISKDTFLAGTAGRMVSIKNLETLIEMAAQLIHDGLRFNLLLIGDGPLRGHLENVVRSMGISQHTVFAGWRSDVLRILQAIDLYVHPSLSESFGYTVVEAMSAGKPVIAFDTGSLSEVIVHDETGFLVPFGNTMAFKKAIAALSYDPERTKQMGQQARKRAEKYFTAARMSERIMAIYQSLL